MTTEFNDRAAHDRPLNDRFSDVPEEPAFDEARVDDKAVINDDHDNNRAVTDDDVDDRSRVNDEFDDNRAVTNDDFDDKSRVNENFDDNKPVVDDDFDDKAVATDDVREPVASQRTDRSNLFEDEEAERFRAQWREVQARFVDEPQSAVREADSLLSSMMDELRSHIDSHKKSLDGEWNRDTKDTEELRVAMQRYRSLFDQILSV